MPWISKIIPSDVTRNPCVYALLDPDTEEVRYVGTARSGRARAGQHLGNFSQQRELKTVQKWIVDLRRTGKKPLFRVLCEFIGPAAWWFRRRCERDAIKYYSIETKGRILNVQHNIYVARERARKYRRQPITFNGKTQTCAAWAREIGMTRERLRQRLEKYPVEIALTTPKGQRPQVA